MRAWSSRRVALRAIPFVMSIVALLYIHALIQFEKVPPIGKCSDVLSAHPLFNGVWTLCVFSMGPSIVMLIFGSLTIRHIQQSLKRVATHSSGTEVQPDTTRPVQTHQKRQKTTDRQLIRMMVVQCMYFSVLSTPVSIFLIYNATITGVISDRLQLAKFSLFRNTTALLSVTSACTSFYIFTLSSLLFRQELMHLFRRRRQRQNAGTDTNLMALTQRIN